MDMKKLSGFFDEDSNRVAFFGVSHVFGWIVAWLQTVWIVALMKIYKRHTIRSVMYYCFLGVIISVIGTVSILLNIQKVKNIKRRRGY